MLFSYSVYQSNPEEILNPTEAGTVFDIIAKPDVVHYYPTFIRGASNPETGYIDFYLCEIGGSGEGSFVFNGEELENQVVFQKCLHTYLASATQYLENYLNQSGETALECKETDFCNYAYKRVRPIVTREELEEVIESLNTLTPIQMLDNLRGDTLIILEKGFASIEFCIRDETNPDTDLPYYDLYFCEHTGMCWQSYDYVALDMQNMPTDYDEFVSYMEKQFEQFCEEQDLDYTPYNR